MAVSLQAFNWNELRTAQKLRAFKDWFEQELRALFCKLL